ncbi:MAG: Stf0 family sulfotransferase [Pseudomonadota bacterium]
MTRFSELGAPGEHEIGAARLFGPDACAFSEDRAVLDVPLLLIAFTNRSGSSLFGELLVQSGAFGGGGEFLNAPALAEMRHETGAQSLPEHIATLARESTAPGQAFALKASWEQLAMVARWRLAAMFPAVHVIHVFRDDTVAQAVSFSIALQTGHWRTGQEKGPVVAQGMTEGMAQGMAQEAGRDTAPPAPSPAPPAPRAQYRESELLGILETQAADNARIRAVTAACGWRRMLVCYEALIADPAHHVQQSQLFCGLAPRPFAPRPTEHRRQAGPLNAEFAAWLTRALAARLL